MEGAAETQASSVSTMTTTDLEATKEHLDVHGYCIVEGAISAEEAAALRDRLTEQAKAEAQLDRTRILPDKKQIICVPDQQGPGIS